LCLEEEKTGKEKKGRDRFYFGEKLEKRASGTQTTAIGLLNFGRE
jgi:hypothetical protein